MSKDTAAALQTAATDVSTDIEPRTRRAVEEKMTVLDDCGRARGAEDLYMVVSASGKEYLVDAREGTCECPDSTHRNPDGGCKHARRVAIVRGETPLPAVNPANVDPQLGLHVKTTSTRAVVDGGIIIAGDDGEILDDAAAPAYTYHRESVEVGGATYVRCEECGAECIPADPDRLTHYPNC